MLNRIISALKALSVNDYLLHEVREETAELFFIRRKLDMRRRKDVTKYEVTVYRDFTEDGKAMRGQSSALLSADADDASVRRSLESAWNAAASVKNPAFALYEGQKAAPVQMSSGFAAWTLAQSCEKMTVALFAADTREDAFLNSAELFLSRKTVRILSSAGTDVGYVKYRCSGEFIAQCRTPQDVEQYFAFSYGEPDCEALTKKVADALDTVCDRAKATHSPKGGTYDLILAGDDLAELLGFYGQRAAAQMVYARYSDYQPGTKVQGENVRGEKLDLTLLPNAPYSEEGIPMPERKLIADGTLQFIHGPTRFCRYLGTEPTGLYRRMKLDNGTVPFDTLKKGCLYPVSFSGFDMDGMSGRFGGEIRLAYLFTESGVEILTGGSVNGSLLEKQDDLTFSTERYTSETYTGPLAVRLKGISVCGE